MRQAMMRSYELCDTIIIAEFADGMVTIWHRHGNLGRAVYKVCPLRIVENILMNNIRKLVVN